MIIITAAIVVVFCSAAASGLPEPKLEKDIYDLNDSEALFEEFVKMHNKQYENEKEYVERHSIFKENLKTLNQLNEQDPYAAYGINKFSDLTIKEIISSYTGLNSSMSNKHDVKNYTPSGNAPDSLDWRTKNAVTEVKDQGACGSCFIFSAMGNIEGQHAIKHGKLISLSEQQPLDCGEKFTCNGGWPPNVMTVLAFLGGSESEKDYPYAGEKEHCHQDNSKIVVKVTGGYELKFKEEGLKEGVATLGPLTSVVAVNTAFASYRGGILRAKSCYPSAAINHGIVVVGYGSENGVDYWIVKNSWGVNWGEKGYIRIERGKNACKIGFLNFQSTVA